MLRALPHLLGFVLPISVAYGVRLGVPWTFLPVALLLVVVPILDALSGRDLSARSDDDELSQNLRFRLVTWTWVIVQPLLLLWTLNRVAAGTLSGLELINLARHADHHMLATKRYQVLGPLDSAPQLPAGYGSMFLLALVPPLWRRAMDPRVAKWRTQRGYQPNGEHGRDSRYNNQRLRPARSGGAESARSADR